MLDVGTACPFDVRLQHATIIARPQCCMLIPAIFFLPCKSVLKVIGQGKTGKIFDSFPMVFAILNGSLVSIMCNVTF